MIDLQDFRQRSAWYATAWQRRGLTVDVDDLAAMDAEVRRLKASHEDLRAQANKASKRIGQVVKEGGDISAAKAEAGRLGDEAKDIDEQRKVKEDALRERLLDLPNPVLECVPDGTDERGNVVTRTWGEAPKLDCEAEPHWEIAPRLGLIDFDGGSRLAGSGFVVYKGLGARLNRALINFFLDRLTAKFGYQEMGMPVLVRPSVLEGTGQLPKFADQIYRCADDDLCLIPTAEVPLTNQLAGEMLQAGELPLKLTGYTPCFRREAGAAGVGTRGITRMHQFDKVEMVNFVHPDKSEECLQEMVACAESLLQDLGLHYRILELCAGDTGFSSAHTYDLEVWSPGTGTWLEVSSCSNCQGFQARRIPLRFKPEGGGKAQVPHTLNGSGLALPRTVIGVLETYLQADGSVAVPEVLQPYLGGLERLTAPA